jgi:hypothetical protein
MPQSSPTLLPTDSPDFWRASVIRLDTVTCYSGLVIKKAQHISPPPSDRPAPPTFQELADQQGVAPVDDFEALLGKPSPDDECAEEFAVRLRQWRREGTGSDNPR